MKKLLILSTVLFLFSNFSQAQENGLNFGPAYDNFIGKDAGSGQLAGFRISYEQTKQQFGRSGSWRSGIQFSVGNYDKSEDNTLTINSLAYSSSTTNYRSLQGELIQKMYFGNGNFQYGGMYIMVGLGLNLVVHKTEYDYINPTPYYSQNSEDFIYQFTTNAGFGYDLNMNNFSLFIESDFNFPIIGVDNLDPFESKLGKRTANFYGISLGIRFNLT